MKLHELAPPPGSSRPKRRVGRGIGGKGGKTAGRGSKGQKARGKVPVGFEGGQLPLMQRIPKLRGFNNPFRVEYVPVNLDALDAAAAALVEPGGDGVGASGVPVEITPELFVAAGLARPGQFVKVLGRGSVHRAIRVAAHGFSATAEAAIVAAGGAVERIPLPYAGGRPPARGNALTNR